MIVRLPDSLLVHLLFHCLRLLKFANDPSSHVSGHPLLFESSEMPSFTPLRVIFLSCGRRFGTDCDGILPYLEQTLLACSFYSLNAHRFYASEWVNSPFVLNAD